MPKFIGGPPPFIGTQDNLTIYLMNGEYIIRTKSSLTGKRVKRDPAFAKTMMYAGWLKQGARIASHIYRQLSDDKRVYKRYRELTGKAMLLLKEGFDADNVITMLEAVYLSQPMEYIAGKDLDRCSKGCSENTVSEVGLLPNLVKSNEGKANDRCSKDRNKYCGEYARKPVGKCVKCNRAQTRSCVSKSVVSTTCKLNNKYCKGDVLHNKYCKSDVLQGLDATINVTVCSRKCNGESKEEYELDYAHEYMLLCYYFRDRPQRAVQVGITGISCLKYADATDRGLIEILKPIRQSKLNS
ncbi:hypothetical protein [Chitinophaga sp. S165]|uniref:hypothetical protein n=1 Tax=Chitinophaga sp. S165 TaxID=2135462 RepID=UPI000D71354F|nr:hypothetical protein [Chitinophaga sp. S165]PWV50411.1 hypothetical protein C7475_10431 [Chitinophaga sp. S165]